MGKIWTLPFFGNLENLNPPFIKGEEGGGGVPLCIGDIIFLTIT